MRTLVYARYSSQLQNSRSIEDQIAVCRQRAEREGWTIVDVFTDYAISGAAGIEENQRPGLNALLARAEAGDVDQVLAESTDRLSRHQGDGFAIRERLDHAGVRLFTLLDGQVDEITGTIKGLFDARFRKDLAARIKRGQQGTVGQGRSPAGLAYGYRTANRIDPDGRIVRGLRVIDPEEAEVVLRIFTEYAAGQSPRSIAVRLNALGIAGPRGGAWRASTIAGDRKRQNGILQNRLYAGVIVHNRTSKIVDPRSRSTRIRPNVADQWISKAVPELRIIGEDLWDKVQAERTRNDGNRPEQQRRPKHLLSGLIVCGVCGGGITVKGNGYWSCSLNREGACDNNRTIQQDTLERRVLTALQGQMLDPEAVSAYVRAYHQEHARALREVDRDRTRLERRHREAVLKMERLVSAIADGADDFAEIRAVLTKARDDRDTLAAELANLEALPVIGLHPRIADEYKRLAADLTSALADPEARTEAMPIARTLIERVVALPDEQGRGMQIELTGRLAAIIALATGQPMPAAPASTVTMERVKGIEPSS